MSYCSTTHGLCVFALQFLFGAALMWQESVCRNSIQISAKTRTERTGKKHTRMSWTGTSLGYSLSSHSWLLFIKNSL